MVAEFNDIADGDHARGFVENLVAAVVQEGGPHVESLVASKVP